MNTAYIEQTRLMLRVLPFVAKEECFALKGGTAINFFVRDMPRLSVDIDLVYLPINSREEALAGISAALKRIKADALRGLGQGFTVQEGVVAGMTSKLFVKGPGGTVKVEPNFVLRKLNGAKKILIHGNHDRSPRHMLEGGFNEVHEKLEWNGWMLQHHPIATNRELLCGHIHEKWTRIGSVINVGVDVWDFTPRTLDELEKAPQSPPEFKCRHCYAT